MRWLPSAKDNCQEKGAAVLFSGQHSRQPGGGCLSLERGAGLLGAARARLLLGLANVSPSKDLRAA